MDSNLSKEPAQGSLSKEVAQRILRKELAHLEDNAFAILGVERTREAMGKARNATDDSFLVFYGISECRRVIDEWTHPEWAISLLAVASEMVGVLVHKRSTGNTALSDLAKRAAFVRHAADREKAETIKEWYRKHRQLHRSMDAAAEVAATTFDVAFRTARKHIGEEAKKLRSARKE
ncbi:hypothetical protein [Accumulibacter sp.]|uniref:hypothetical protein n=1 Tax=Accumulibacter sp. TaxID=2053492 RepID=UPI0025EEB826|nr:hypothetical protein [Accumulibacter sp.]MCP5227681.1 hypothetical protein [Accumulibacter sp.]